MKIINKDMCNQAFLHEPRYRAFLGTLGIPQEKVDALEVRFVPTMSKEDTVGTFCGGTLSINLRTQLASGHFCSLNDLNVHLAHETRHFQVYCERGDCYQPDEDNLPYEERPSEIDADAFARKYWKRQMIRMTLKDQLTAFGWAGTFHSFLTRHVVFLVGLLGVLVLILVWDITVFCAHHVTFRW